LAFAAPSALAPGQRVKNSARLRRLQRQPSKPDLKKIGNECWTGDKLWARKSVESACQICLSWFRVMFSFVFHQAANPAFYTLVGTMMMSGANLFVIQ
jgi:hypothetical protein